MTLLADHLVRRRARAREPSSLTAAAVFALPGYRVWVLPDDPTRCTVTLGGTEEAARAAVVTMLHERQCGDYTFEAHLMTEPPQAQPCAWCERDGRYAH